MILEVVRDDAIRSTGGDMTCGKKTFSYPQDVQWTYTAEINLSLNTYCSCSSWVTLNLWITSVCLQSRRHLCLLDFQADTRIEVWFLWWDWMSKKLFFPKQDVFLFIHLCLWVHSPTDFFSIARSNWGNLKNANFHTKIN